jgi:ribosomal protein S18 acetylase RimI-like enzyme
VDGVDWEQLCGMYRRAPLGTKTVEELRIAFSNSRFVVLVYDGQKLAGAGRALADGADCSYICDVALEPEYQGCGLGREIVSRLIEMSAGHRKILLFAVPGKEPFYEKFGFRRMKTAMAIFQDQKIAFEKGLIEEL